MPYSATDPSRRAFLRIAACGYNHFGVHNTQSFGREAFARPDFVGWTVCGWVDTWSIMPNKDTKQHSGFFTPLGEPHEPYIRRLRELSGKIYEFAHKT